MEQKKEGLIGINKYKFLKSLSEEDRTEEEKKLISDYEETFGKGLNEEYIRNYTRKLFSQTPKVEMVLNKKWLWKTFLEKFSENEGKEFIQNEETITNVKSIMLYFLQDPDFLSLQNVNPLSKPCFKKGLLIVGDYGCGKSSIMSAIQKTLYGLKGYSFRNFNANEVVKIFESITPENSNGNFNKREFDMSMTLGDIYFDDIKTERIASNFGKVNIFREIFEIRSRRDAKTYLTCNFKEGKRGDVCAAVDEFEEKYGERVYDRIYEMFNIVEFKGKSFRV